MSSDVTPGATTESPARRSGVLTAVGLALPLLAAAPGLWLRLSGANVPVAVAAGLTAAQSVFAVALVVIGRLTKAGAWALLGLFLAQFAAAWAAPGDHAGTVRLSIASVYLALSVGLLTARRRHLLRVPRTGLRPHRPTLVTGRSQPRPGGAR